MIVTIRLIRSFEHRNIQHLVMKDVDTNWKVTKLKEEILDVVKTKPGLPPPFRKYQFDTLKISHQPHKTKANTLIIDTEHDDELILKDDWSLSQCHIENETEISFFKYDDYVKFQNHPEIKW